MDAISEKFATYAAQLSYADLTAKAVHAAKRSIVDSIGCAIAAYHAEPVTAIRAMAAEVQATKPATVIGTRSKSSPELAGFANSVAIRYLDFSDDYFGGAGMQAGPHPSDNIGAVLAAAESNGGDGKSFILGTIIAYEVCAHLVDHVTLGRNGWDYPIYHSAASALGVGKMLGLNQSQLGHALGLAIVANVCLRETRKGELSIWKGMAGPNGSRNGLFAAQLARAGVTGPGEPFEGNAGLMKQLDAPFKLGELGGHGRPFKVEGIFLKYLPVMYSVQLPIIAALKLRTMINLDDVVSIVGYVDAHVSKNDAFSPGRWDPKTRETADHSGPYLMGAALVDGEISEATMTPQRYRDPYILSLIKKIRMEEDPAYTALRPGTLNCRLQATLKSGEVVSVHEINPKGHPANPLSDDEVEQKFLKQVEELLPAAQSRALLDALWKLEDISDLGKLFELMAIPAKT